MRKDNKTHNDGRPINIFSDDEQTVETVGSVWNCILW